MHELRPASLSSSIFASPRARGFGINHLVASRSVDFLLVGGGLAAGSCARTLREEGAEGSILLVGREPDPPYDRPPLSKEYLAGKQGREDGYVRPTGWWEENEVEL